MSTFFGFAAARKTTVRRSNARRNANRSRVLRVEKMEDRCLLAGNPWGMDAPDCVVPAGMYDVTGDGVVSAADVLAEINFLNGRQYGGGVGARPVDLSSFQYDVTGDGWVTPLDPLTIVNEINRRGPYRVEDVLRCDNPVTFSLESLPEVTVRQGEDEKLFEIIVRAEKAEAVVNGLSFSGNLEDFAELYVAVDWDGDGWHDATTPVSSTWFDEWEGTTYAWFDLSMVESTVPARGHLGIELHGTSIVGVGSQATVELTYASVESFPGYQTWAETSGVSATITTAEPAQLVFSERAIGSQNTAVSGEKDISLAKFDVVADGSAMVFTGVHFVAAEGSLFNGQNYLLWLDWDQDGTSDGWVSRGRVSANEILSFDLGRWYLGDGEALTLEVRGDVVSNLLLDPRLQLTTSYVAGEDADNGSDLYPDQMPVFHTDQMLWNFIEQGSLIVEDGGQPRSRLLLGGERTGESVLRTGLRGQYEPVRVDSIVVGVTGGASSISQVELFLDAETVKCAAASPSGTATLPSGEEAVLYTANLGSSQFVVDKDVQSTVTARPRVLSDVLGGVSGETPTFFLYSVTATGLTSSNDLPVSFDPVVGNPNEVVMAKANITNKLPDRMLAPGWGVEIARMEYTAATNVNTHAGRNEVVQDGLIFTIAVDNAVLTTPELYNTADPTQKVGPAAMYSIATGEQLDERGLIEGPVYVLFEGLAASAVQTEIRSGQSISLSLSADIRLTQVDPTRPGLVQVSLSNYSDPAAEFGIGGSHVHWKDVDGAMSTDVNWLDLPETAVFSGLLST